MIWLYARGNEALRLETRFDQEANEFVLVVVRSDQRTEVHRFSDQTTFEARLRSLEEELAEARWCQVGSPRIVLDGWKGP
jgi:hypothetical protein